MELILLTIIQICTFLGYLPQMIKAIRTKKTDDVAISSWVLSFINANAYLAFGILIGNIFIIITTVTEVILAFASILVLYKYRTKSKNKINIKQVLAFKKREI